MPSRPVALILHADSASRRAIADALDPLGLRVVEAGSARQGLELAGQLHPDLVFLGDALPDGTAGETMRQLRAGGNTAPVVLLLQADADEVLREPVTADQVQHLVGQLLGGR